MGKDFLAEMPTWHLEEGLGLSRTHHFCTHHSPLLYEIVSRIRCGKVDLTCHRQACSGDLLFSYHDLDTKFHKRQGWRPVVTHMGSLKVFAVKNMVASDENILFQC